MWWCTPIVLIFFRLRQGNLKLEVNLGYTDCFLQGEILNRNLTKENGKGRKEEM